jgi:hypothetical protein
VQRCAEAPMVTVEVDAGGVERRLGEGRLSCPECGARLSPWGHARARTVRELRGVVVVRPRRARCSGCGITHVLLPVSCLLRRADTVEVIGMALAARAGGAGHRTIAARLGRAPETVRGWLRRLGGRLEAVRSFFTVLMVRVEVDPVVAEAGPSAWADALTAIGAAWSATRSRWRGLGAGAGLVTAWWGACAATSGRLLSPSWPPPPAGW